MFIDLARVQAEAWSKGQQSILLMPPAPGWTVDGHVAEAADLERLLFDDPECRARTGSALMRAICDEDAPFDPHIEAPLSFGDHRIWHRVRPPVSLGDALVMREPFRVPRTFDETPSHRLPKCPVRYQADLPCPASPLPCGRPRVSTEMPLHLARLRFRVADVVIMRLCDVPEAEARAAGAHRNGTGWLDMSGVGLPPLDTARAALRKEWSRHGSNPWVAMIRTAPGDAGDDHAA